MSQDINSPVAKASISIGTAIGAQVVDTSPQAASMFSDLLVLTWPNLAAFAAFLYTVTLMGEFCWKKFWRPALERWGLIEPRKSKVSKRDVEEWLREQDTNSAPLGKL